MPAAKVCTGCKKDLPIESFSARTCKGGRPRPKCKACEAIQAKTAYLAKPVAERKVKTREWEKNNPELFARQKLRRRCRKLGIPETLVDDYLKATHCAICNQGVNTIGSLHFDHCHAHGHFRGFLCSECNLGLGKFADDPERLRAAAAYLEQRP